MLKTRRIAWGSILLLFSIWGLVGCGSNSQSDQNTGTQTTAAVDPNMPQFDDAFAYCQARETVDQPGPNYTGDSPPVTVAEILQQTLTESDRLPETWDAAQLSWRCMAGNVMACVPRQDMQCNVKLNFSRRPAPELNAYCSENFNAIKIPASVVSPTSPYDWLCDGDSPMVKDQRANADQAGFNSDMWFLIESSPES